MAEDLQVIDDPRHQYQSHKRACPSGMTVAKFNFSSIYLIQVKCHRFDSFQYDGYLNSASEAGEGCCPGAPSIHAEEFKAEVSDLPRQAWDAVRFWVVYQRREDKRDPETNDIRNAAFRLTRGYSGVIVIALSLLGKRDSENDVELVFVCFEQDFHRRNFRVRYEGKAIDSES